MRGEANKNTQVIFSSTARTATVSATMNCPTLGGAFIINCTAKTSTPSVTFTVAGVDPASDTAYTILTSAAITGTGTTVLRIHPSLTAATNTIAKDFLPAGLKITATHGNTDSITYSVGFAGVN